MMAQIVSLINFGLSIYSFALIVYIFMSWFPGARESQFGEILGKICEPYLEIFRKFIPPIGMIDFSPIVAILLLQFARQGFMQIAFMF